MSKTAKEIIYKAMRRINFIAMGDAPDANDYQEALEEYEGFHEWLRKEFPKQIRWDKDAVPVELWTHVSGWFAGRLTDVLPVGDNNKRRAEQAAIASETYFREMLARDTIEVTEVQYF